MSLSANTYCRNYCVDNTLSTMSSVSYFIFLGKPLIYTDHEASISAEDKQDVSLAERIMM